MHKYLIDELADEEFKDNIQEVIDGFKGKMPDELLCQDVGLIIWERENKNPNRKDEFRKTWMLLDGVSPKIRKALGNWLARMKL